MTRQLFDVVARDYDAYRPDYPAQLFDALESAMGQPLLRADVLDVGAGTGIATRALAGRGANVVAVDPGPEVLGVLRSRSTSRVRAVIGDGNALPVLSERFDLVSYAQAFHWTDPARSVPESLRVLKPGGVLALWWNRHDPTVRWYAEHQTRLSQSCTTPQHIDESWVADLLRASPWDCRVATIEIPWRRRLSLQDYGRCLLTQSHVFALGDRAQSVVETELEALRADLGGEVVDEPFVTYAVLARP
jgi:SAM-dependent methyltransferase